MYHTDSYCEKAYNPTVHLNSTQNQMFMEITTLRRPITLDPKKYDSMK